jgi:hypothetical protein
VIIHSNCIVRKQNDVIAKILEHVSSHVSRSISFNDYLEEIVFWTSFGISGKHNYLWRLPFTKPEPRGMAGSQFCPHRIPFNPPFFGALRITFGTPDTAIPSSTDI